MTGLSGEVKSFILLKFIDNIDAVGESVLVRRRARKETRSK